MIRDTIAPESEPTKKSTLFKNVLLYILIFTFFVVMGFLMVYLGQGIS